MKRPRRMTPDEELAAAFAGCPVPAGPISKRAAQLIARILLNQAIEEIEALERKESESGTTASNQNSEMRCA